MANMRMEWRSVGLNYAVSNFGRVRRLGGKFLRPVQRGRYLSVNLGANKQTYIHHLVAAAFIGPRPVGWQINHIDGDRWNNMWTNLEYVTPKGNQQHASRLGLLAFGERNGMAKLTTADVEEIRRLLVAGLSSGQVAAKFNVGARHIRKIKSAESWPI